MKLACFAMMRNEASILDVFLDQAQEFFDYIYILDHSSTDDSLNRLALRNISGLQVFHLESSSQPQSEMSTLFAKKILSDTDSDFLFLLDSDEFLSFSNRTELERYLQGKEGVDVIYLPWKNIAPQRLHGGDIFDQPFSCRGKSKINNKIILSKSIMRIEKWNVSQGNHRFETESTAIVSVIEENHVLYHLPVRSSINFHLKILAGSLRMMSSKRLTIMKINYHWLKIAKRLVDGKIDDNDILEFIYSYSEKNPNLQPVEGVEFTFPYLKKRSIDDRDTEYLIRGVIAQLFARNSSENEFSYRVVDRAGHTVFAREISGMQARMRIAVTSIKMLYYKTAGK